LSNPPSTPPATPLSLHDALPISHRPSGRRLRRLVRMEIKAQRSEKERAGARGAGLWICNKNVGNFTAARSPSSASHDACPARSRSEEHTSELQSRFDLVCRLLLE